MRWWLGSAVVVSTLVLGFGWMTSSSMSTSGPESPDPHPVRPSVPPRRSTVLAPPPSWDASKANPSVVSEPPTPDPHTAAPVPESPEKAEWTATLEQLTTVLEARPIPPDLDDRQGFRDYLGEKGDRLNHLKSLEFDLLEQLKEAPSLERTVEIELALATLYRERAQDIDHLVIPDHYSETRAARYTAMAEERSLKNFEKADLMQEIAEYQAGSLPADSRIHALLAASNGG